VVSFPQVSPLKSCIHISSSPIRAAWPAHLILLDLIIRTILGEEYRSLSSSLCSFFHSRYTSLLGSNILLSTLFSNTLSLRSSLNVSDQVFTPIQNNKHNSIYLHLYIFWQQTGKQKILHRMMAAFSEFNLH
jgi:hypothetical protein